MAYKEPVPLAAADRPAFNTRVFTAAWSLVNEHYFDPNFHGVDWPAMRAKYAPAAVAAADDEALYRVLNQMLGELRNAHVYAFLPRLVHEGRARHKPDTGLRSRKVEDRWVVMDVVPGSAADAAGVRRGWLMASRNGRPLSEDPLLEVLSTQVDQPVDYGFIDERDQLHSLRLVPQLIAFDQARFASSDVSGGIRYLRFDFFDTRAVEWLNREIESRPEAPGLVIDLRSNPGGHQSSLRRAIRTFFPHRRRLGQVVDRSGKTQDLDSFAMFSPSYRGKVAILTSEATASSAEIFAHAMQFHQRAVIVGQQTAGKVVGAIKHRLPGGGYLDVPDLDFVGLDGRRLEGAGVTPNLVVPLILADLRFGRDAALETASSWLRTRVAEE